MTEKTLTTENIKPAIDALRGELAPWPVVAKKQDRLNDTQKSAVNSGITSGLVAQISANTAAIRALESAITGTGLRPLVVASLPAIGTQGILYIVPVTTYDPSTDADVVNYSNEYIWIVAPDAPVTEGYYEQVGQTGIVINNGQLNITVNGTSVGTFTANQSGDTTAAITVPTNADYVDLSTSQTVSGQKTWTGEQSFTLPIVGSITGTASKAIADEDGTSIKTGYGKLAGNQTWTGTNTYANNFYFKDSTVVKGTAVTSDRAQNIWDVTDSNNVSFGAWQAVQYSDNRQGFRLAVSNNYLNGALDPAGTSIPTYFQFLQTGGSAILKWNDGFVDNNILPIANSTYSLGSAYFRWSAVYADSYYYGTTAWGLDKANEWTGDQTIASNRFLRVYGYRFQIKNAGMELGTVPSSNQWTGMQFVDKNNTAISEILQSFQSNGNTLYQINIYPNEANSQSRSVIAYTYNSANNVNNLDLTSNLIPSSNNTYALGNSNQKWKTLNGVNPGALSLPKNSNSASYNIDTTNWTTDGSIILYTPLVDGWLYINARNDDSNGDSFIIFDDGVSSFGTSVFGNKGFANSGVGLLCLMMPVNKNNAVNIRIKSPGIISARIYPCNGNV